MEYLAESRRSDQRRWGEAHTQRQQSLPGRTAEESNSPAGRETAAHCATLSVSLLKNQRTEGAGHYRSSGGDLLLFFFPESSHFSSAAPSELSGELSPLTLIWTDLLISGRR